MRKVEVDLAVDVIKGLGEGWRRFQCILLLLQLDQTALLSRSLETIQHNLPCQTTPRIHTQRLRASTGS